MTAGLYVLWMLLFHIMGVLCFEVAFFFGKVILLNYFLVMLIATLFGMVMAHCFRLRAPSYILMLIATFFMLPYARQWVSMFPIEISGVSVDTMRIADFLDICAQNTDAVADLQYGTPIEACRWYLAFFWICFFALCMFWKYRKNGMAEKILRILLTACCILGFAGFLRMGADSTVLLDDGKHNVLHEDSNTVALQDVREADFQVVSYDIAVKIKSRLVVSQPEDSGEYYFTLYHGYRVKSVTDGDGNAVAYERIGDYRDITVPPEQDTGTICVQYEGNGNRFYSNTQGVALMGYFAWYPRAGHLAMFDGNSYVPSVNVQEETSHFRLRVTMNGEYYTNLKPVDQGLYEGDTNGLTLTAGLLQVDRQEDMRYIYPILQQSYVSKEQLTKAATRLNDLYGLNITIPEGDIISLPSTIQYANGVNDTIAMFEDHVVVAKNVDLYNAMLALFLPEREGAEELFVKLTHYPYESGTELAQGSMPSYEDVVILVTGSEEEKWMGDIAFEELFWYQIRQYGETEVLRACFAYLSGENDVNEVDFLYHIEEYL